MWDGWTPEKEQKLTDMYENGRSIRGLAAHFDVSKGCILRRLKRLNLSRDPSFDEGPWNDDRVRQLHELAELGLSATQIAERIGMSRGAVSGKCGRLGVTLKGEHTNGVREPKPVVLPPEPPKPLIVRMIPLVDLSRSNCHFPIGDPDEDGFGFCGLPVNPDRGLPYCPAHCRKAYRPDKPKNLGRLWIR